LRVKWHASTAILVFAITAFCGLMVLIGYCQYRQAELDSHAPIVETCVKHRVTQQVIVQGR
jgi:hypothetical protein